MDGTAHRLAIDIGGTFTDLVAVETGTGDPLYAMRFGGGVSSFRAGRGRAHEPAGVRTRGRRGGGGGGGAAHGRRARPRPRHRRDHGQDVCRHGRLRIETLHHIERTPRSAGYPVQAPVDEIVEIGAGGGSMAWLDDAGDSTSAPGAPAQIRGRPATGAAGPSRPTLTDANIVAGRLDPDYFLGGATRLDPDAAVVQASCWPTDLGGLGRSSRCRQR